jgi:hypothetical protein
METFQERTNDLQCTAKSKSSAIAELYQCVNGTGILLDDCTRGQSTDIGRVITNCSVTINAAENVSESFYCIERMLFDPMNYLSAQYSIVVVSSKPLTGV